MFSTLTFRDALPISAADDGSTSEVISKRLPTKSFLATANRSEEHTSELQSLRHLVCRLLLGNKSTACESRACRLQEHTPCAFFRSHKPSMTVIPTIFFLPHRGPALFPNFPHLDAPFS